MRTYTNDYINSKWLLIVKEASHSKCSVLYGKAINRGWVKPINGDMGFESKEKPFLLCQIYVFRREYTSLKHTEIDC